MPILPICRWSALCALLLIAVGARADLPSPANTIVPSVIALVATNGSSADPNGRAVVIARDAANVPMVNSVVELDFSGAANDPARDLFIAATQPFPACRSRAPASR